MKGGHETGAASDGARQCPSDVVSWTFTSPQSLLLRLVGRSKLVGGRLDLTASDRSAAPPRAHGCLPNAGKARYEEVSLEVIVQTPVDCHNIEIGAVVSLETTDGKLYEALALHMGRWAYMQSGFKDPICFDDEGAALRPGEPTHMVLVVSKRETICYQNRREVGRFGQSAPIFSEGVAKQVLFGHYSSRAALSDSERYKGHFPGELLYARFFDVALSAGQIATLTSEWEAASQSAWAPSPTGVLQIPPRSEIHTPELSPSTPPMANGGGHSPAPHPSASTSTSRNPSWSPETLTERLSDLPVEGPALESTDSERPISPYHVDSRSASFKSTIFGLAKPSRSQFFGRADLLDEMMHCICGSGGGGGTFLLLHGPPGFGKTKIAKQLCLASSQLFQFAFWVDASRAEASYTSIYQQLQQRPLEGLPARLPAGGCPDTEWLTGIGKLVHWACQASQGKLVLLVVDCLEEGEQLEELHSSVPEENSVLVVTTRLRESELREGVSIRWTKSWRVGVLEEQYELQLLGVSTETGVEELKVTKDIIKGLRRMPVLLGLASKCLEGRSREHLLNQTHVRGEAAVLSELSVEALRQNLTRLRHAKASLPWWEKAWGMTRRTSAVRQCAWQIVMVAAFLNHNATLALLRGCVSRCRTKTLSYFQGILLWTCISTLCLTVLLLAVAPFVHDWCSAFPDDTLTVLIWMLWVFGPLPLLACYRVHHVGSRPLEDSIFEAAMDLVLNGRRFASRQEEEDVYVFRYGLQAFCREEVNRERWIHTLVWLFPRELFSLAVMEELASAHMTCDAHTEPSFQYFCGNADTLLEQLKLNSQYHLLVIMKKLALYHLEAGGQWGRAVEVCERALKHLKDRRGASSDWSQLRWELLLCYTDGLLKRACSGEDFGRALTQSQLAAAAGQKEECQTVNALLRTGLVHELRGEWKTAEKIYSKADNLSEGCKPKLVRRVKRRLAWVAHRLGKANVVASLQGLHEKAMQAVNDDKDPMSIVAECAQAEHELGHAAMWDCNLEAAEEHFREAHRLRKMAFADPHADTASSLVALVGVKLARVSRSVHSCHVRNGKVVAGRISALLPQESTSHLLKTLKEVDIFSQLRALHTALDTEYYLLPEGHRKIARTLATIGHLWGVLFFTFAAALPYPAMLERVRAVLPGDCSMGEVPRSKNELRLRDVRLLEIVRDMDSDSGRLEEAVRGAHKLAGTYLQKAYSLQRAVMGHHPGRAWTLHLRAQLNLDGATVFKEAAMVAAAVKYAREEVAAWGVLKNKGARPFLRLRAAELLDVALRISNQRLADDLRLGDLKHSVVMLCEYNQPWPEHCKPRGYTGEEERCLELRPGSQQFEIPLPKCDLSKGGTIEVWVRISPGVMCGQVLGLTVKGGTLSLALETIQKDSILERFWTLSLLNTSHREGPRKEAEMTFVLQGLSRQKAKRRKSECEDVCLALVLRPVEAPRRVGREVEAALSAALYWKEEACRVDGEAPAAADLASCTSLLLGPSRSAAAPEGTLHADVLRVRLFSECLDAGKVAGEFAEKTIGETQGQEQSIWTFAALGIERAGVSSPTATSNGPPEAAGQSETAAALEENKDYRGAIREYSAVLSSPSRRPARLEEVIEKRARCYNSLGEYAVYRPSFEHDRGPAFVISMEHGRLGPCNDANTLESLLANFRFAVTRLRNPSMRAVRKAIERIDKEASRWYDCLFIAVCAPGCTRPGGALEIALTTESSSLRRSWHKCSELATVAAKAECFKGKPIIIVVDSTEEKEPGFLKPAQSLLSNRLVSLFSTSEGPLTPGLWGFLHALWDLLISSLLTVKGVLSAATWECVVFGQRMISMAEGDRIYIHCHRLVVNDEEESPFIRSVKERLATVQERRLEKDIGSILEQCARPSFLRGLMRNYVGTLQSSRRKVVWRDGPPL